MNLDRFTPNRTGDIVPVTGVPALRHAFVPAPLPADWDWPDRLWPLLLEARTAIASLAGIAKLLPSPDLLLRPLQNREAQRSSSLEGTITDPHQQALFQIDPSYPTSASDEINDYREVFNYRRALRLRGETKDDLPLSLRLICGLHRVLMDGVRGSDQNPGSFRTTQNQVGRPARFVPPPPQELTPLLDNLEKYLHEPHRLDPLVEAFLVHYQFEAIHPFSDGNGRVGRLLLSILIAEWCGLSSQWLYMSAFFDQNKDDYIDRLFAVSANGEWEEWIEFCLRGAVETARDTESRCERLLDLNRDFHQRVQRLRGSYRLSTMIDELFDMPVVRVAYIAERHSVHYNTAKSDLDKLSAAGVLEPLEGMSTKTYFCPQIFAITYEDDL